MNFLGYFAHKSDFKWHFGLFWPHMTWHDLMWPHWHGQISGWYSQLNVNAQFYVTSLIANGDLAWPRLTFDLHDLPWPKICHHAHFQPGCCHTKWTAGKCVLRNPRLRTQCVRTWLWLEKIPISRFCILLMYIMFASSWPKTEFFLLRLLEKLTVTS